MPLEIQTIQSYYQINKCILIYVRLVLNAKSDAVKLRNIDQFNMEFSFEHICL